MREILCLLTVCAFAATQALGQAAIAFSKAASTDRSELARSMPGLAREIIAKYREEDREKYLDTLFRMQMVGEQYEEANATLESLRDLRRQRDPVHSHL